MSADHLAVRSQQESELAEIKERFTCVIRKGEAAELENADLLRQLAAAQADAKAFRGASWVFAIALVVSIVGHILRSAL